MKLYKKEIKPFKVSLGSHNMRDVWEELEDWQPEENETEIQERYNELLSGWTVLRFKERFKEVDSIKA